MLFRSPMVDIQGQQLEIIATFQFDPDLATPNCGIEVLLDTAHAQESTRIGFDTYSFGATEKWREITGIDVAQDRTWSAWTCPATTTTLRRCRIRCACCNGCSCD